MRSLILVALLLAAVRGLNIKNQPLITKAFVDSLNSQPGMTWEASYENGIVTGATEEQIKRLLGARMDRPNTLPKRLTTPDENAIDAPTSFDSAKNWPHCKTIPYIWDQSECGSCWAVGAAGSISDRYCTMANKNLFISPRNLMSCCETCGYGCNGGYPQAAFEWWVAKGLLAEACQPYPFPHCEHHTKGKYPPCGSSKPTPPCSRKCTNTSHSDLTYYKGKRAYGVNGEDQFQQELMEKGPFEVTFQVFDDFPSYKRGVYQRTSSRSLGWHAVRLVGWGVMNGVNYWKIANSWNEDWGDNGYFLIKRGSNECSIETNGAGGDAA